MKKNIIALSLLAMCLSTGAIHGSDESYESDKGYEGDERSKNYCFNENCDYDYDLQEILREAHERSNFDKDGSFDPVWNKIRKINDHHEYLRYDLYPKGIDIEKNELRQKWLKKEIDEPEYFDRMLVIKEEYDKKIQKHTYIQVFDIERTIEAYDDKEEALRSWLQKVQQKYE